MRVYEKIAWLQLNDAEFSLRNVFGKERLKYMLQGLADFTKEGYSYGVEPLTHANLDQFYELYKRYISTKHNAKVHDLLGLYSSRIDAGESIYLGYLRKGNTLLGGGIFIDKTIHGKRGLVLGFRAIEDDIFNRVSIGYYIEYLFFTFGLDLGIEVFSRGMDRNGYGMIGSNVGLPIHKIQLHFSPHVPEKDPNQIEIDTNSITVETIIFSQSDTHSENFDIANVWTKLSPEDAAKTYDIFTKRGLNVHYFYLK